MGDERRFFWNALEGLSFACVARSCCLRILQPVLRPPWLQGTPILIEVESAVILIIREQSRIAQLRASIGLSPQCQRQSVAAPVVHDAWWEREASLRSDLWDKLSIWSLVSMKALNKS